MKSDIEAGRIEKLAQLLLNRAQNLILIQPRADRLPDFSQKLIFLGAPLRIVHDHVILKGQADLQRQPDQQP